MSQLIEVRLRPVRRPNLAVLRSGIAAAESYLERAAGAATPRERCMLELHAFAALSRTYRAAGLAVGGHA